MADRTLTVRIIGDDAALKRTFASSERSAKSFAGRMSTLNQGARGGLSGFGGRSSLLFGSGAFISTAAITTGLQKSISAASDLNEQISKSRQVFEEASQEVVDWSRTTATSIGIAQVAALSAAGSIGNMVTAMGIGETQAAQMSIRMVQLAADMASFNNEDPSAMLERIRSGLAGEMEPLRRFGSILSASRVEAFAFANGIAEAGNKLTEQQKILARYGLLLQDTAKQHDDFARTSDSLANQSRILNANLNELAASIGGLLVPGLTDAAEAANFLLQSFDALGDFKPLGDPTGGASLLELLGLEGTIDKSLVDVIRDAFGDAQKELDEALRPDDRAAPRGPGAVAAENVARAAEEQEQQLKKAKRDLRRTRKSFAELATGLGLKLDKAGLTKSLSDDIDVLREIERAILRQIEREGRTFKLAEQLTKVRLEISSTIAERAKTAAEAVKDAWAETLDSFALKLDVAEETKSFADDRAVLQKTEQAILRQIKQEGRTTDLLQELANVRQQQAEVQREMVERTRELRQERQFKKLGLTAEGEERAPGRAALRHRLGTLQAEIKGTVLDTEKTRTQLQRIAKVLSGQFGLVGREVRAAILAMFNDLSDALEDKGGKSKFRKMNVDEMLKGLGLSPEELKALRARLSQIGPGGTVPGRGVGAFGFAVPRGGGGDVVINGDIHVTARDADQFLREMQKRGRRGKIGRRGVGAGVGLGLG